VRTAEYEEVFRQSERIEMEDGLSSLVIKQLYNFGSAMQLSVEEETAKIFETYIKKWEDAAKTEKDKDKRKQIRKQVRANKKAIRRLISSTLKNYNKQHLTPPWLKPVSLLTTAMEGYAYGSEKGQVKQISDHNHILPLYDYGIGTFDFDMKKVKLMIELAQAKAKDATLDFFK
jgi:uncharacterized membrane protein YgaE (UPF0421/DUF939 family)